MNMDLKFHQVCALARRGSIECGPDEDLGRVILVGTEPAGRWKDGETSYGYDYCSLWPAWDRGERAWFLRRVWIPMRGHCFVGTDESLIPFEAGVRLLIEREVFAFPAPQQRA